MPSSRRLLTLAAAVALGSPRQPCAGPGQGEARPEVDRTGRRVGEKRPGSPSRIRRGGSACSTSGSRRARSSWCFTDRPTGDRSAGRNWSNCNETSSPRGGRGPAAGISDDDAEGPQEVLRPVEDHLPLAVGPREQDDRGLPHPQRGRQGQGGGRAQSGYLHPGSRGRDPREALPRELSRPPLDRRIDRQVAGAIP